jgi:hypothetical protein
MPRPRLFSFPAQDFAKLPIEPWGDCDVTGMATKKTISKTSKRTVIEPHAGDRRYVRRNKKGEFNKEVAVGRFLAADRRQKAKTKVAKDDGDRGDVKR